MGVVGLTWYLTGILALLAFLASTITGAPGAGRLEIVIPGVLGGGAVLAAGLAIGLGWLPPTHWVRQSRSVWRTLVAVAVTVTVMLILVA